MSWVLLVIAGLFEVVWAAALPATEGLKRPTPTAVFVIALAASMYLLAKAVETIPLGTAYTVWVGIGAVGAVVVGLLVHGDPVSPARLGFLALLIVALVGVKLTSH